MEETVEYAHQLGRRIGDEPGLSIYCYENAAQVPERRNLADVREGEYEGLAARLEDPQWKPDFGPATFNPRSGATAVGARRFLVAYNVNLNTTSVRRANAIAFDVRERGRRKRIGHLLTGEIERDASGEEVWIPGSLEKVKAIGWFIEEYRVAQISMNLTDIDVTPVHIAFDEVCRRAEARGVRVTGSELVGLIPLDAMLDAGRHYLRKQHRSTGISDSELIKIAVKSLGLDELAPFDPQERIIEYAIADGQSRLVDLSVRQFVEETASESVAPGGGSVAANLGALGAARCRPPALQDREARGILGSRAGLLRRRHRPAGSSAIGAWRRFAGRWATSEDRVCYRPSRDQKWQAQGSGSCLPLSFTSSKIDLPVFPQLLCQFASRSDPGIAPNSIPLLNLHCFENKKEHRQLDGPRIARKN